MTVSYDDLVQNTPVWLYAQNRDIVNEMPKIISDAEDHIINLLDHYLFQQVVGDITVLAGDRDVDLSSYGILELRSMRAYFRDAGGVTPLERRDLEAMTMLYASNRQGRPRYYSQYGGVDTVRLFPIPSEDIDIEVTANVMPPKLGVAQQTNIISEKFPRVMERAVLRQGAIFMKNNQDEQRYAAELTSAITEANSAIGRLRRDETGTRPVETINASGQ